MSQLSFLTRGIVTMLVAIGLITIMAIDHKELSFAEDEWDTIEDAFGSDTTQDVLEEAQEDSLPRPDVPETEEEPPWWAQIPILGPVAQGAVDVGTAIWAGILTFVEWVRSGFAFVVALFGIFWAFVTFDIPALSEYPTLRLIFIIFIAPFWVAIPYIAVRMLRGGG